MKLFLVYILFDENFIDLGKEHLYPACLNVNHWKANSQKFEGSKDGEICQNF